MEEKQGFPAEEPIAYPAQPPPGYQGQPPPNYQGQQQPGYPVQQQQPGYPAQPQPGYPVMQQPGYQVQPQMAGGYPGQQQVVITMPVVPVNRASNYLALAIISTLCCCPICGIVGIVYASQVDSAYLRGDAVQAESSSMNAKRWSIAAIVSGCVWILIVIIYYIILITYIIPSSIYG